MSGSYRSLCCVGLYLAILSPSASGQWRPSAVGGDEDFRLFFVPAGEDPRDYAAGATVFDASRLRGNFVQFEIFIEHAPVPIRYVECDMGCALSEGAGGSIYYQWGSARYDISRSDFLFFQTSADCSGPDESTCPDGVLRFGCGENFGPGRSVSEPKYFAEFELFIPLDAEGTYTLTFLDPGTRALDRFWNPIPGLIRDRLVLETGCIPVACQDAADCVCPFAVECTLEVCDHQMCVNAPQEYGDVNEDGVVDTLDILCAVDGFGGRFDNCTFAEVDIYGCQGDGVIDLRDILAVLDAFGGIQRCTPWCGPP